MSMAVIDTNVLLVANGAHDGASDTCRLSCIAKLLDQQRNGITVLDDAHRILREYQHKTSPNKPRGVGDVFLKWLLQNQANPARVHQVTVTESSPGIYAEFPDAKLQAEFDPPDRVFVAVANAHPAKPPIWQATDSKWIHWWATLASQGVTVQFICPSDAERFLEKKFPDEPDASLPASG